MWETIWNDMVTVAIGELGWTAVASIIGIIIGLIVAYLDNK